MEGTEKLRALYAQYEEDVRKLLSEARPFAGFFGFGTGPKDDPAHQRFCQAVQQEAERMAEEGATPEAALDAVRFLLSAQQNSRRDGLAYWTMMAAQGAALALIPRLSPEGAKAAAAEYEKTVPRRERMPLQDRILKALRARGAEA